MIGTVVVKGLRVTRLLKSEKNQNLFFQTLKRQKTNSRYYEARIQTKTEKFLLYKKVRLTFQPSGWVFELYSQNSYFFIIGVLFCFTTENFEEDLFKK